MASRKVTGSQPSAQMTTSSKKARSNGISKTVFNDAAGSSAIGSITRIKMVDFLTYDHCEFFPGASLNVIVGPNGTGKSSVVCAICLVLGGSTALLGRAKEIGDYVKHGKNEGLIEIELFSQPDPLIIRRQIFRLNNRSKWFLNSDASSEREVVEQVAKMGIQINNLCQFIPQDKVVEFAKLSQQQLLVATQRAVGKGDLEELHQLLVDVHKKKKQLEISVSEKVAALNKLEQRNCLLERDVQRYWEREANLEHITLLEQKKGWLEYEQARLEFQKQRSILNQIVTAYKEAVSKYSSLHQAVTQTQAAKNDLEFSVKALGDEYIKSTRDMNSKFEKLEKLSEKIEECQSTIQMKKGKEAQRKEKIAQLKKQVENIEAEIQALPRLETYQAEIKTIHEKGQAVAQEILKLQQEAYTIKEEIDQHTAQMNAISNRKRQLEDINNQRLQQLQSRNRDAYQAVLWLRSNRHLFRQEVHDPIMLQINMHNVADAKYVEMLVSSNDLCAFVCQNVDDLKLFLNETRVKQKLSISAVCPPNTQLSDFRPSLLMQELSKYGFRNFVMELFSAPDAVVRYLCQIYRIHEIPVGTEETDRLFEQVVQLKGLSCFYTPSTRTNIQVSRYTGYPTTTNIIIRPAKWLQASVHQRELDTLENELLRVKQLQMQSVHVYQNLQKVETDRNAELDEIRNRKKELNACLNQRKTLISQLNSRQDSIRAQEEQSSNIANEEMDLRTQMCESVAQKIRVLKEALSVNELAWSSTQNHAYVSLRCYTAIIKSRKAEQLYNSETESLRALETQKDEMAAKVRTQKAAAQKLLVQARLQCGLEQGAEFPPRFSQRFNSYPNKLDEIEARIHQLRVMTECAHLTDLGVVQEYTKRKEEISRLKSETQQESTEMEDLIKMEDENRIRWIAPLKDIIQCIDHHFERFFKQLGCAGQVDLAVDQDGNYEKFGIEIRVKFRAGDKLSVLTPFHQSGGERSVATMLFMLALQELTTCPFRVVDEINQGMDPNNERRVFRIMVDLMSQKKGSQYFFISPKLLPNLAYSDNMTVLTVMNGPGIPSLLDHLHIARLLRSDRSSPLKPVC